VIHHNHDLCAQAACALVAVDPKAVAGAGVYDLPRPLRCEQTGISSGWRDDD